MKALKVLLQLTFPRKSYKKGGCAFRLALMKVKWTRKESRVFSKELLLLIAESEIYTGNVLFWFISSPCLILQPPAPEVSMLWLFSSPSVQGRSYDPGSSRLDSIWGLCLLLRRKRRSLFMEVAKLQRWGSMAARSSPMPTGVEPVNKTNKAEGRADRQGQVHNNLWVPGSIHASLSLDFFIQ